MKLMEIFLNVSFAFLYKLDCDSKTRSTPALKYLDLSESTLAYQETSVCVIRRDIFLD
jgi:hypothetical protein